MEKKKKRTVKREECSKTKHDAFFSPWKILVGPSDWDDHCAGKEGAHRYRIHNLPENFPGLYELGIAKPNTNLGTTITTRSDDLKDIVIVYLGQADNVRMRLQHYGRTGSHLECGKQDCFVKVKDEPGLFREVFALGCSIVFRCVPMKNKLEAEKREAQLLGYFDYAWNRIYNGSCRREEILSKLEKKFTSSSIHHKIQALKRILLFPKQVGVRIDNSVLFDKYIVPEVRKIGKSRPQVIQSDTEIPIKTTEKSENICGIALGDGTLCAKKPMKGRKRCEEHKGRRIVESKKERILKNNEVGLGCGNEEAWVNVCGVISEIDGSICKNPRAAGRKRCEDHKGRRKSTKEILVPVY